MKKTEENVPKYTIVESEDFSRRTSIITCADNTVWRLDSAYIDGSCPALGPKGWETMLFFDKGTRKVLLNRKRTFAANNVTAFASTAEEMNSNHDNILNDIENIIARIIA